MNVTLDKRIPFGFAVLLPLLAACNPALQWREPQQQPHSKFVCNMQGLAKSCVRMTDAEFRQVMRQLQPGASG